MGDEEVGSQGWQDAFLKRKEGGPITESNVQETKIQSLLLVAKNLISPGTSLESFQKKSQKEHQEQKKRNEDQDKLIAQMQKTITDQKDLIEKIAIHPELRHILQSFKTRATSQEILGQVFLCTFSVFQVFFLETFDPL